MKAKAFVKALDDERVLAAIREAEEGSRGEVRVHVAGGRVTDARAAAEAVFPRLGMTGTVERNGVLIFVAPESQTFAVVGDEAIDGRVEEGFWSSIVEAMAGHFRSGQFTDGIVEAVRTVGAELARHFPRRPGEEDVNELPDAISQG
jgi:uncharacterized membrane protein